MISNNEIVALIPARPGSKSVKDKNIYPIGGKPLLAYSVETAKSVISITSTVVTTSSKLYGDIARAHGADWIVKCPEHLSLDTSIDIEFTTHFLQLYMRKLGALPKFIIHLRPTTPFRNPHVIETAIARMMAHPDATALRSVERMPQSSYKTFEVRDGYLQGVFTDSFELDPMNASRHDFPDTYDCNGYVDILRPDFIMSNTTTNLKRGKLHGNRVIPFITPAVDEVDTQADLDHLNLKVRYADADAKG